MQPFKRRRTFAPLLLLLLLICHVTPIHAADVFITVIADSSSAPKIRPAAAPGPAAAVPDVWLHWGRMDRDVATFVPKIAPAGAAMAAQAAKVGHTTSVVLTASAPGGSAATQVKAGATLEAGLYRVEAVLVEPAAEGLSEEGSPRAARSWRMESVLLARPGISTKLVRIRAGQTLMVRWTETVTEARFSLQMARRTAAAQGGPTTYTGVTIAQALGQAARLLGEVQTLTVRGNRSEIAKRTHRALLLVAQAQAMARNRPDAMPGDEDDMAFAKLTMAVSEISLAACNLVPAESMTPADDDGPQTVRVSLTNAGQTKIPFVTLALPTPADAAAAIGESRRRAFRTLAPGAKITAGFPSDNQSREGGAVVQFILGMGAAVVTAAPPP